MFKALLKKEIMESFSLVSVSKKGKKRSAKGVLFFALLLIGCMAAVGYLFWITSDMLCKPLVSAGLTWLYFALMGTMATALGLIGTVFAAKAKLYEAKDNDLLLSMPIPSRLILCVRMAGLYLFIALFEWLVFLPAVVCYFVQIGFAVEVLFGSLIVLLIMPFGTLAICALLGWIFAVVSAKLPYKNWFTFFFAILFFVAYMVVYSQINEYLTYVIEHGAAIGGKMKTVLYPFYQMGLGATGDWGALAVYGLLFLGLFALTYALLSATYLRLVTANKGVKRGKYEGKEHKVRSQADALLAKEAKRYFTNPMIALNCFLGTVMLLILPFVGAFNMELMRELSKLKGKQEGIAMVVGIILASVSSTNLISGCSLSLEGNTLWILKSTPVKTEKIFFVKVAFHWLMTAFPMVFACVFFAIILKMQVWLAIEMTLACLAFVTFTAILGLVINLKMPKLNWSSELAAVKQNFGAVLAMFAEWATIAALVGGYFLFGEFLFIGGYFLVCAGALLLFSGLLVWWLRKRGKRIFEEL